MNSDRFKWLRITLIWMISTTTGLAVGWLVPTFDTAATNALFRFRGALPRNEEILIVGIDDESLRRIGKYPWPRSVTATALERITEGSPAAIGLDIVYSEASDVRDDERLAAAIAKSGRVVMPVHLNETPDGASRISWLEPLPVLGAAAARKGHVHAAPDTDGTLRSIQLSKSDDLGRRFWAFGLEILRVAENIAVEDFEESDGRLRFGAYQIYVADSSGASVSENVEFNRANEMIVNYVGPANSFRRLSFADVVEGRVPPATFDGKLVLVGATSPTLGDSQVTPFMNYDGEGGRPTSGVEVHANVVNTIRSGAYLAKSSTVAETGLIALIGLLVTSAIVQLAGWRQIAFLAVLFLLIIAGSVLAFGSFHTILPVSELLTSFFVGGPLLLLDRSWATSRDLDIKLGRLAVVQNRIPIKDGNGRMMDLPNVIIPRSLSSKLRAVDEITSQVVARLSFIDRVLTGMNDGVMIVDEAGTIVYASERAVEMMGASARVGHEFGMLLASDGIFTDQDWRDAQSAIREGGTFEREFGRQTVGQRFLRLRLSPVVGDAPGEGGDSGVPPVIGTLALLSDVTEEHEIERLKAETVQLVSHELRAPLTSIKGLSDVMLKFPVAPEQSREMVHTINVEAIRLSDMIGRFLDIKRLESGTLDLRLTNVDLPDLLKSSIAAASPAASEKGIVINLAECPHPMTVRADSQLLAQAVGNLLSNAVKYSPADSVVNVVVGIDESELRLVVSDSGFGIPADQVSSIFKKFFRLERDAKSATAGTGLGLAFVKEAIEKHGGRVTVESEPGVGSTFTIILPL